MNKIQKLDKQQASAIVGGFRFWNTLEECQAGQKTSGCFYSKKKGKWSSGGAFDGHDK